MKTKLPLIAKAFTLLFFLSNLAFAQSEEDQKVKVGDMAPEISLPNPDGKILKLSDYKGKLVLVDFWAGWCGPCRRMNRKLVKTYDKFKDDVVIFSVSLDLYEKTWKKAIEQDELVWDTQVSDLKGWDSPAALSYGIRAIPNNFLLDKTGKVIAIDVSSADIKYFIKHFSAR